ncbi:MAG: hypothetical protein H0X24_13785, partial [Ktedonobacterales bacterium]|nr:hypothetical protein [Ktedonobacterales bacterium]
MFDGERPFVENLDEVLASRVTSRGLAQRLATLLVTLVAGAVVLVLVVNHNAGSTPVIPHTTRYDVSLSSDITWGMFTITANTPLLATTNPNKPTLDAIYDAPAQLNITLTAPPFAPQTCRLTLPPDQGDTCRSLTPLTDARPNDYGIPLPIHFRLTSADLPTQMALALVDEVDQRVLAVTPQVSINAGSHYAAGSFLITHY